MGMMEDRRTNLGQIIHAMNQMVQTVLNWIIVALSAHAVMCVVRGRSRKIISHHL